MAKKKHKQRAVNPHKMSEVELKERIDHQLEKEKLGVAYDLVKVLVQRFDTPEHQALLRRILEAKLKAMGDDPAAKNVAEVIAGVKKRFSGIPLEDTDELVRLSRMRDAELIAVFREQETIPDSIRSRIADALYFSEKPDREFIRKHKAFKDVFFVKEAFANGFDPERTRQLLSAIGAESPYRPWILLRKAIEAFLESDDVTLKVLKTKVIDSTFPAFIISRLFTGLKLLQGRSNDFLKLPEAELSIMMALCGPTFITQMLLRRLAFVIERQQYDQIRALMAWAGRHLPASTAKEVAVLTLGMAVRKIAGIERRYRFIQQADWFPNCDVFLLIKQHLLIKFLPKDAIDNVPELHLFQQCRSCNAIRRQPFFKADELKAELLAYEAGCIQDEMVGLWPLFFSKQDYRQMKAHADYQRANLLEDALKKSKHNPVMMVSLIDLYVKLKESRSKTNRILDMLLKSFPDNPEGYRLAGEIAQNNKAYQKAIGFYSQAHERSPLNRDLLLNLLRCYEGIIDKRSRKDVHLIDRDLAAADVCRGNADQPAVAEAFGRIRTKAVLKKLTYEHLSVESAQSQLLTILETEYQQAEGAGLLRLVRLINQEERVDAFPIFLHQAEQLIIDRFKPADFGRILTITQDSEPEDTKVGELLAKLLIITIQSDLRDKRITVEQYGQWMTACVQSQWFRSFVMLVLTAHHRHPEQLPFLMLVEGLRFKPDHQVIQRYLSEPKTIDWFMTPTGSQLLRALSSNTVLFESLYQIIEGGDWSEIDELMLIIDDKLAELTLGFNCFWSNLSNQCDKNDQAPIEIMKELIGDEYALRWEDPYRFRRFGKPEWRRYVAKRDTTTGRVTISTPAAEADTDKPDHPTGDQLSFLDILESDA
jgi:tetratricopeptide (TPR) repeat protein